MIQGSYAMHTGVESIDKEYDIDVALRFNVNKDDYEPMELKNIIYDILKEHTEYGAKIKNPCVTVTYYILTLNNKSCFNSFFPSPCGTSTPWNF